MKKANYIIAVTIITALSLFACGKAGVPSKDDVKASVKKILPVEFEVADVREMREIPALVEVVIKLDKQPIVFYMDKKGKYIINGSVLDTETKKNITMERQQAFTPAPQPAPAQPVKPAPKKK